MRAALGCGLVLVLALGVARAEEEAPAPEDVAPVVTDTLIGEDGEYRTPLAGEPLDTVLFGRPVHVDKRDRTTTTALALGTLYFTPEIGDQSLVPFAAFFANHQTIDRHFRAVVSVLVNEVDFAQRVVSNFEALLHFENYTIPFPTTEVVDGDNVDVTALTWGTAWFWVGAGWRIQIPPGYIDNDLHIEAHYQARHYYFERADDTDPSFSTPPETYAHGVRLRFRLDSIQRNLFEMPHRGFALGSDAEFVRRDRWRDFGPIRADGRRQFLEKDTRDYIRIGAYAVVCGGLPFLSERHRFVAQVHAGWGRRRSLDRFSGFRIGGGPQPTETADLVRSPYPGSMFDQFFALDGVVATVEYRFEALFFVFLHFRATYAYGRIQTYHNTNGPPGPTRFVERGGTSLSAGVTSGFAFNSSIYIEYAYDTGTVRAGAEGHTVLLMWSKAF